MENSGDPEKQIPRRRNPWGSGGILVHKAGTDGENFFYLGRGPIRDSNSVFRDRNAVGMGFNR